MSSTIVFVIHLFFSEITHDDLTAQVVIFFVGGFETSSTLLSFALYELALNPDIQKRLREEIDTFLEKTNGKFTYQGVIHEMEYLNKVVAGMNITVSIILFSCCSY